MNPEDVKGKTELSKVVGKGLVEIPIGTEGMVVKANNAPMVDSSILSVSFLGKSFNVLFSEYNYGIPCCATLDQNSGALLQKYALKDGLYPKPYPGPSSNGIVDEKSLL